MKRKIAVFANGWNYENLYKYLEGLRELSNPETVDFFVFLCHATYTTEEETRKSMATIFDLPNPSDYDGIVIFHPGLNFPEMIEHIYERAEKSGVPTIIIGAKHGDFYHIGIDNYNGMKDLCDHIIDTHGVKKIKFIAGSRNNVDSDIRLEAVIDSVKEHNLIFDKEKDVFYSDWELKSTSDYTDEVMADSETVPDAIICANDYLAEIVTYAVENAGYSTPEDVIVTGFDFLQEGQVFYPSIASVDQKFDEMARKTVEMFRSLLDGADVEQDVLTKCVFCPGESCGCKNRGVEDGNRRIYARSIPRRKYRDDLSEGRRNFLEKVILDSMDYSDLKYNLKMGFSFTSGQEGNTFYCMLDPELDELGNQEIEEFPKYRFARTMDVAVAKKDGKPLNINQVDINDLIPNYTGDGANHIYYCMPLHVESFVCGYIIMSDINDWLATNMFFKFENRFNHSLVLYRRNVQVTQLNRKLSSIMEKDPLTGVKNRRAFEEYMNTMSKVFKEGILTEFAVVYFDVNNLKMINDNFGHEAGDIYIKNCCKLICDFFKKSPVFRIGGDEFVSILTEHDYDKRELCLEKMRDKMRSPVTYTSPILEQVSIAAGIGVYNPETDKDIRSVFKRADEAMYENKQEMKRGQ